MPALPGIVHLGTPLRTSEIPAIFSVASSEPKALGKALGMERKVQISFDIGKLEKEPKETKQPFSLAFLLSDDIHLLCLSARHMHRVYPCPVSEQSCRGDPVICAW